MSYIKIICRKDIVEKNDQKDYSKYKKHDSTGHELILEANQWFMDTEEFFNSVKETLEKYFDNIKKK